MINTDTSIITMVGSPVRSLKARVELLKGSTLLQTFKNTDKLRELTIERVGEEGKFFGFGICQKLNIKLIDINRELDITTANTLDVAFGANSDFVYCFPYFKVTQCRRDENTNELSITAYDALYEANTHILNEIGLPSGYSIEILATDIAGFLGLPIKIDSNVKSSFSATYAAGANVDGTETLREILDDIAEATQTIYYIDKDMNLTFKRLDKDGEEALLITKEDYITLDSGDNKRLAAIASITELGDNLEARLDITGSTQYVRDNPFWDIAENAASLVDAALAAMGGLTINQFNMSWRGNFLLEIGDKFAFITKDEAKKHSYLLDDIITYNGVYSQHTQWKYTNNDIETATNPTSIGDALKQTYARVNKVDKEIDIVASETSANSANISSLLLNTERLTASVEEVSDHIGEIDEEIQSLKKSVELAISPDNLKILIEKELNETFIGGGTDKVITSTGFTFDEDGLTISKSGNEMTTQITEDGMTVSRNDEEVLTANNEGVVAVNLHAKTYLIIGLNSRFEDYANGTRTGCFWIGD